MSPERASVFETALAGVVARAVSGLPTGSRFLQSHSDRSFHQYRIGVEINGIGTDIAIRQYSNSLLVVITQTGKLKNCVQVEKEDSNAAFLPANSQVVYKCTVKFGPDCLEDLAAVQFLCEKAKFPNNTMISVCLIENTPPVLSALSEILLKHKTW